MARACHKSAYVRIYVFTARQRRSHIYCYGRLTWGCLRADWHAPATSQPIKCRKSAHIGADLGRVRGDDDGDVDDDDDHDDSHDDADDDDHDDHDDNGDVFISYIYLNMHTHAYVRVLTLPHTYIYMYL